MLEVKLEIENTDDVPKTAEAEVNRTKKMIVKERK